MINFLNVMMVVRRIHQHAVSHILSLYFFKYSSGLWQFSGVSIRLKPFVTYQNVARLQFHNTGHMDHSLKRILNQGRNVVNNNSPTLDTLHVYLTDQKVIISSNLRNTIETHDFNGNDFICAHYKCFLYLRMALIFMCKNERPVSLADITLSSAIRVFPKCF